MSLDRQSAAMSQLPQTDGALPSVSLEQQAESADRDAPVPLAGPINKLRMAALLLVLQHLGAKSKLKAARCSRWLLFVASNSSAWLGTAPIRVDVRTCTRPDDLIYESKLLRVVPIALHVDSTWSKATALS